MRHASATRCGVLAIFAAVVIPLGCQESAPSPKRSQAAARQAEPGARIHHNADYGFQLEVPAAPWVVRWRRYRADTPERKLKGTLKLLWKERTAVSLDVWTRSGREPVSTWFDKVLRGTVSHEATRTETRATAAQVPTLRFSAPESPQASPRLIAVFAIGSRVYRLLCHDADDPAFRQAFERALRTFRQEDTP